jgi:hypothetical protein
MTNVPMDWRHHHHHHHGLPNLKSTLLSCLRKLFQMKNLHENSNFPIKLSFLGQKKLHLGGWNQYPDCLFEALNFGTRILQFGSAFFNNSDQFGA